MTYNEIITKPWEKFNGPLDVLNANLSKEGKEKTLLNWKDLCLQKYHASEEGMNSIKPQDMGKILREINEGLNSL
ncbi:MAG: hypothetical protein H6620_05470 [Halobacteriovoraceae bacterium]|nr:hypothetical protein [Halobacteriovoraceae bacterium]